MPRSHPANNFLGHVSAPPVVLVTLLPCWQCEPSLNALTLISNVFSCWPKRVDLCHQATDEEEEEDEDEEASEDIPYPSVETVSPVIKSMGVLRGQQGSGVLEALLSPTEGSKRKRKGFNCCSAWRGIKVRGRQKAVVLVRFSSSVFPVIICDECFRGNLYALSCFLFQAVIIICALTAAFALLIWVGLGDNSIDPQLVARVQLRNLSDVLL